MQSDAVRAASSERRKTRVDRRFAFVALCGVWLAGFELVPLATPDPNPALRMTAPRPPIACGDGAATVGGAP